jgi:hypothetical protein
MKIMNVILVGKNGALECSLDTENGKLFSDSFTNGFVAVDEAEVIFEDSVRELLGEEEYSSFLDQEEEENGEYYPFTVELNRDENGYYSASLVCGNCEWMLDLCEAD